MEGQYIKTFSYLLHTRLSADKLNLIYVLEAVGRKLHTPVLSRNRLTVPTSLTMRSQAEISVSRLADRTGNPSVSHFGTSVDSV